MVYLKWAIILIFWLMFGTVLHYTLPQHDVAWVTDTEVRRVDFGENSIFWAHPDTGETPGTVNRDVQFIRTVRPNGKPFVYRNEDTGWGWPPYFKFDTDNLQTEASKLRSTESDPNWVVVTHYGWRIPYLTIYPNAVRIKSVDGPDHRVINWFNIIVLTILAALIYAIWVRWRRFREKRIDPVLEDVGDSFDAAGDAISERRGRFRRWLDSWRS
ncbi:DUF1523 family protein [Falsiphaeobacter marinintestinus]|uniref:DUF1523 family protein n=1 Tax=Falsiphaeobacter marinintestinus TaxID=1492905 RepID=UPI0011B514DA|nr:DUF1523 family protein [Phaeobacter marinintestinus]